MNVFRYLSRNTIFYISYLKLFIRIIFGNKYRNIKKKCHCNTDKVREQNKRKIKVEILEFIFAIITVTETLKN